MYLFYTFGLAGGFTLGLPYFLYKFCTTDKYRGGIKERFGFLPPSLLTMLSGRRPLWIHGVSVGEITAVTPLVTALQEHYPALPLLVSTGTVTGQQTARKQLPTVRHFCYFPLDFPWVVRRVVDRLQPRGVILVETEIWPNFLRYLARHQIPVLLVNGRISPRSFRGYRWIAPFMRRVLADMTFCSMQTVQDAERLLALGADPDKV
ncbi:MAG: 3-deoxy-D-manno-octulosonic acid transferase, partial [Nitrospinota bacterium]